MISKNRRIPRELFKPLLESRKYFNSAHFSLRIAKAETPRLTISVSKKVSKKAVVRNKIRRRVYSAVHNLMPELSDNLFLLIAKVGSENIKGQDLKDELVELLKKV